MHIITVWSPLSDISIKQQVTHSVIAPERPQFQCIFTQHPPSPLNLWQSDNNTLETHTITKQEKQTSGDISKVKQTWKHSSIFL